MSKVDRESKRVKFRAGARTIILKPIPQTLLADAMSEDGKPEPPMKEIEYLGGVVREEPDEKDVEYQKRYQMWQTTYNVRMLRLCIALGVDTIDGPPPDQNVIAQIEAAYGKLSSQELQMRWVMYLIGDQITGFLNLALGQTVPTKEGLEEAEERFPDIDARAGDTGADN